MKLSPPFVVTYLLALLACPSPGAPPNVPPDATDASPMEGAPTPGPPRPGPATGACVDACSLLAHAGCRELQDNCAEVLQIWNDLGTKKNPRTGRGFVCTDLAGSLSPAEIRANGFRCLLDGG
jgi:hypothetical protein